nr:unnamed protein product [uncultured bacterium]
MFESVLKKEVLFLARISSNQGRFAMQPQADIRRSRFDRSFVYKTTFDEGKLIPYFVDEVLPGDTFKLSVTEFCRLATPICPFMDNLHFDTHFFFVPYRLVWDNFVRMCGEQDNPEDSTDFSIPQVRYDNLSKSTFIGTLVDYFGISSANFGSDKSGVTELVSVSALPFRAYWLIWNEWFRDENLQSSVKVSMGDTNSAVDNMGSGTGNVNYSFPSGVTSYYHCAPRGKRYDYFTSCLPWPQKGPGVELPLGSTANVSGQNNISLTLPSVYYNGDTGSGYSNLGQMVGKQLSSARQETYSYIKPAGNLTLNGSMSGLSVDLSSATSITINSLRQAFMLQRYYEVDARGGTRYTEKLQAHFGVTNPDSRLQRPEYLGGRSSMFNINPVAQTSSTNDISPQGNMAAYGIHGRTYRAFNKSFTEFGVVIGLCSVRADLTYQQGTERMWFRKDDLDFYWPEFAHLGEQAVLNQEIYVQGTSADTGVFGYQERYAEYRYKPNKITGQFRSTYKQTLDVWHLAQKFDSLPKLGDQFIQDHPPVSRVVAVPSYPHFLLDVKFHLQCVRPLPLFSIPGLMPHF